MSTQTGYTTSTDHLGRTILLIPDTEARRIHTWKDATWTEVAGVGYGYTEKVSPGHPMWELLSAIADASREAGALFVEGEGCLQGERYGNPVRDWSLHLGAG